MEKPAYYSVIPSHVRYDNELKAMEVLMYGELTALANHHGYAFATNNYFAKLYKVHKNTVSVWINNLKEKGYISVELIKDKNNKIKERRIYINTSYQQNHLEGYQRKHLEGINENIEDNNTSTNITSIKNSVQYKKSEKKLPPKDDSTTNKKDIYTDIISYLNEKANKSFKTNSKETIRQINGRLNEGYKLEDFKKVIDNKTSDWLNNDKMNEYLRPKTLFRPTNFENYLNETQTKQVSNKSTKNLLNSLGGN